MTDGSGEDSELFLTNTVKKKVQDWVFLSRRISLKHMAGRYGRKSIAMIEEPQLALACRH